MAITKMSNIMSHEGVGSKHLYHLIQYIMNPEKTEGQTLIGGNSGSSPSEVYDTMMDTKKLWEKEEGRQAYHFVISFPPDQVTVQQTYSIVEEWCRQYLKDDYDYVFAVHNDRDHLHGHIIFNSINCNTGYKYRYTKGDWEKFIQPLTDEICRKHGVQPLEYDKRNVMGAQYKEHVARKEGKPTWTKIIKADIDYVINQSASFDEFLEKMTQMGYQINQGKHLSFLAPGAEKARRDHRLGPGYHEEDIKARIEEGSKNKQAQTSITQIMDPGLLQFYDRFYLRYVRISLSVYQRERFTIFYRAGHYLESKNPYIINHREIRQYAINIDRLYKECSFLIENDISSIDDLRKMKSELSQETEQLKKYRTKIYRSKGYGSQEEKQQELDRIRGNLHEIAVENKLITGLLNEMQTKKDTMITAPVLEADLSHELKCGHSDHNSNDGKRVKEMWSQ